MKVVALCPELTPTIVARSGRARDQARQRRQNGGVLQKPSPRCGVWAALLTGSRLAT